MTPLTPPTLVARASAVQPEHGAAADFEDWPADEDAPPARASARWAALPTVVMPSGDIVPMDWAADLAWASTECLRLIEVHDG